MAKISRQVGTASEKLAVFVRDATNTSSAGLANIVASSVNFTWCRDDQATFSSGTCSSGGTIGTYNVSMFTQFSSTSSLGWYQFCPPDGIFASGKSVMLHLYGAPSMVPVPIEVELTKLDNQTYLSSVAISTVSGGVRTSSIVTVGVSNFAGITVGVSSNTDKTGYSGSVNVSALAASVFVSSAISSDAFSNYGISTVAGGVRTSSITPPVGVSAFALPVGVSSFGIAVGVSSFAIPVGVSTAVLLDSTYGAAGAISTNLAFINGVAVTGTGVSSDLWRA